jgi:predicted PurR-regulated permease PerM
MINPQKIEVSSKSIVFTIILVISLWILWQIRDLLLLFFICLIFMESINPTVQKLEKAKIPRSLAILIIYLLILVVISLSFAGLIPVLVEQTAELIRTLPQDLKNLNIFGFSAIDISSQFQILQNLPANIAKTAIQLFSNIFSTFVILVITFYLLLERRRLPKYAYDTFGKDGEKKALKIIEKLESRLGAWVNAEIILMVSIGVLSYIGYVLLGLNYAVPLALVAGLLEIVPNIGPTMATIFAAVVAYTISPFTALLTVGWGVLVQLFENHILVPRIMKDAIGINPIVTIFMIAIGFKIAGVIGALLAIPTYLVIESVVSVFVEPQK